MKLLIVEDEQKMARLLRRGLTEEGHVVDVCETGESALDQLRTVDYDVIVLDWMLPDQDGMSVLRRLREGGRHTPVLMLTARGTVGERVAGLRAGADDYLVKPFDFEELLARLDALFRRGGAAPTSRRLGTTTLDLHKRALVDGDKVETLTAREFQVMAYLCERVGDVVTRAELLSQIWGAHFDGEPNVVDVYIGYLRSKLRAVGARSVEIRNIRSIGYRLTLTPESDTP